MSSFTRNGLKFGLLGTFNGLEFFGDPRLFGLTRPLGPFQFALFFTLRALFCSARTRRQCSLVWGRSGLELVKLGLASFSRSFGAVGEIREFECHMRSPLAATARLCNCLAAMQ